MKKRAAFTLIELSIVLVIIGVILAAVMGGSSLIRDSKINEFTQTFVNQWITVVDSYYSRKGMNLADGTVNGGNKTNAGAESPANGLFDGNKDGNEKLDFEAIDNNLSSVGIDICGLIKTDIKLAGAFCTSDINPFQKSIEGTFTGKSVVTVYFSHYEINGKMKNILLFANIPGDVGKAIDLKKDGSPDGTAGNVLAFNIENNVLGSIDYEHNDAITSIADLNSLFGNGDSDPGDIITARDWEHNGTQIMGIVINH